MNKILTALLTMLITMQSANAMSIDSFLDKHLTPLSDFVSNIVFYPITLGGTKIPIVVLWILIGGLFFSFYLRGIAAWGLKQSIKILKKPAEKSTDGGGEVSPLQSLMTALSGTVGLGSIAGVALSISIGGPGAVFWIFIGALLGMALKFVEAALAIKYRRFNLDGSISGGPMHYMAHGLTRKKMRWLGQPLSVIFAILCIGSGIAGGNMIQINQTAQQVVNVTGGASGFMGDKMWLVGLVTAVVLGIIVIGGIKQIAKVAEKVIPFMCVLYILAGVLVILMNIQHLPHAIAVIVKQAFHPDAMYGGFIGVVIAGLRRSVQTNEAGTGSAPIAYATAQTKEPISLGFVSLTEPLFTGFICMLTATLIIISNAYIGVGEATGIQLTSRAFESAFSWFPYVLALIVVLFAVTTILSWAYYAQKAWNFLVGEGKRRTLTFQLIFCLFTVIGSVLNVQSVINLTDAMMMAMAIPNLITMYILAPEIKKDLAEYCRKHNIGGIFTKDWRVPVTVKGEE